jgi:hypothetical protein
MTARQRNALSAAALLGLMGLLSGCGLAGSIAGKTTASKEAPAAANPGEPKGKIPPSAKSPQPIDLALSPEAAILRFAGLYINWNYRNLPAHERQLAASATGDARLAESQAAASAERDRALQQGHIYNRGTVISVATAIGGAPGQYALVTREETGGNPEYAGLRAAFHVTLATVQHLPAGWAVDEWQPQS